MPVLYFSVLYFSFPSRPVHERLGLDEFVRRKRDEDSKGTYGRLAGGPRAV
jgi:hypothetical protein